MVESRSGSAPPWHALEGVDHLPAVELGLRAGARRVVLFHHQPDRTDNALDELPKRFGPEPQVIVAAESLVLEL